MFEYENTPLLLEVLGAIDAVNKVALPDIVGTLRSYELTPEQREAADKVFNKVETLRHYEGGRYMLMGP